MGIDQRPATPQPLPDIRYRGDLSVFDGAVSELRASYGLDPRIEVGGLFDRHDSPMVRVIIPFVYDRRVLPDSYRGLYLAFSFPDMPDMFQPPPLDFAGTHRDSEVMERFVDTQAAQIRESLGNPEMSREEMLDALSAGWAPGIRNFADLQKLTSQLHRGVGSRTRKP